MNKQIIWPAIDPDRKISTYSDSELDTMQKKYWADFLSGNKDPYNGKEIEKIIGELSRRGEPVLIPPPGYVEGARLLMGGPR